MLWSFGNFLENITLLFCFRLYNARVMR